MVFSVKMFRRAVLTSAGAAALALSPFLGAIAQAQTQLSGAGATFPAPLYSAYFRAFQAETDIQVNYQAVGSGAGIRQVIAGTVDFGGTDAFMTAAQIEQVGDRGVILVPTAGGAVAVVYNLPGVSELRLSSAVLPDIFAGQITRWNDPRIVADNPGVNMPDLPIRSIVRADSSGTTSIFTNHLSAVSPYFRGRIGAGTAPRWTTNPLRANGNPGVAAQVQRTRGAIGYVELAYADNNNIPTALVENGNTEEFVKPSLETARQALDGVEFDADFRAANTNPEAGYPIVGITWMMVYKDYPGEPETEAAIKQLVDWILTDGQEINPTLNYVSIPGDVAERAMQAVDSALVN
jgi:phosphate transport system substrate-binding protein